MPSDPQGRSRPLSIGPTVLVGGCLVVAALAAALLPPWWALGAVVLLVGVTTSVVRRPRTSPDVLSASAVHEILNPLSTATAHVTVVTDDPRLEVDQRASLERALSSLERTRSLLRHLAAPGSSTWPHREEVDLSSLVRATLEDFAPLARNRGVSMSLDAPPATRISADATGMRQVLDNLLSNAVKYNEDGGWIDVVVQQDEAMVTLSVENPGHPLSAAELPHVFEDSFRGRAATDSPVDGSGLGLGACRRIVTGHGGHVEVESSEETGTTSVRVVIPRP